ncbi:formylglycine-generating enzyme family protein [Qipengyuania flava]|nr:formylglycine-generating enzyme family protein [Qipengyuania flava]
MVLKKSSLVLILAALAACSGQGDPDSPDVAVAAAGAPSCLAEPPAPVRLPGGTFTMGSDNAYAEEGPERSATVGAFWIDPVEVTNRSFAQFVEATGYVTVAERPVDPAIFGAPVETIPADMLKPGSAVFTPPDGPPRGEADWWSYVPGASWKAPFGPGGGEAEPAQPIVHLALADMLAYAEWKGGRLPTEAEWEYAARAGSPSGLEQPGPTKANSWQGVFPMANLEEDGFAGLAPVGCFEANAFGLYDMVGNAWEMTADPYAPGGERLPSVSSVSAGGNALPAAAVIKGGSYLCAPNYCMRYRAAARQGQDAGMGASNVGFRLVYDSDPAASAAK